jgi:hypothetical protein
VDWASIPYFIEGGMLGDVRTLISAEAAFASDNFGFYDMPECLQAPNACLSAPYAGPAFLPPGAWSRSDSVRRGGLPAPRS